MNKLKGARIYLSGPIESSENATGWRNKLAKRLSCVIPTIRMWDPLQKPSWTEDIDGPKQVQMRMALESVYSEDMIRNIRNRNHMIRRLGQSMAAQCDIVILGLDGSFTAGSLEEVEVAKHKPIFVLNLQSGKIPSMWLVDQLDAYNNINFVFHESIDSLVSILMRIDNGTKEPPDPYRWLFMTHDRE